MKRLKLDYEEITPCLKEVTKVWESMFATPGRPLVSVNKEMLRDAVKDGRHLSYLTSNVTYE